MIDRAMQLYLEEAAKGFPVITITGPRQSGKTTLAKMCYPDYRYLDLEDPELRLIMQENPKSLLNDPWGRYIIDEFQLVPSVLSQIKVMVDVAQLPFQFILMKQASTKKQ
ncbi:MAG: AAA family ATPase [Candidatus Cloacimonas sp.]|jgi:predicted AAA+ superfamily ATPase|nr:AAA family ATPase [Candidatus Cloacimonas sp.]